MFGAERQRRSLPRRRHRPTLEPNCVGYTQTVGDVTKRLKPVGLMQRYKDKMYFGAFGYLQLRCARDAAGRRTEQGWWRIEGADQTIDNEITETGAFKLDPYGLKDASKNISDSGSINTSINSEPPRKPTSITTRLAKCMPR
jgi:hypothetical protein